MKLVGIELRNFLSVGDSPVNLYPLKKCNVLIGQNNVGKSNIIKFLQRLYLNYNQRITLTVDDCHRREPENTCWFKLYFCGDDHDNEVMSRFTFDNPIIVQFEWGIGQSSPSLRDFYFEEMSNAHVADALLVHLTNMTFRNQRYIAEDVVKKTFIQHLAQKTAIFLKNVPPIHIIPEFRKIDKGDNYTFAGHYLIELLAEYQRPRIAEEHKYDKFVRIERFVQRLLHMPEARLEVTIDNTIALTNNGLRLPLESYGTGVHELIILITAVLSEENVLFCIEEPEIHLHPTLQREFVEFLITDTDNQYIISTHSPTLINAHSLMPSHVHDELQVFHLQLEDGATVGVPVLTDNDSLIALNDLGVKASDLLQSNCVIWVEGPSDRVYINHWIELLAPELIEGLHYSVMFYGGTMLSHLSLERHEVPRELIEVLKVNQNAIVVIDSDCDDSDSTPNATKKRVRAECNRNGGYGWITDGREIENYLPPEVIEEAYQALTGKSIKLEFGHYDRLEECLNEARAKKFSYATDKVRYARLIVQNFELHHMDVDLTKRLNKVIEKIEIWNYGQNE